ncbi:hypothetical protein GCM10027020_17900 [Nocardioides salsibiostraticola]
MTAAICATCGETLEPAARFCEGCGTPVASGTAGADPGPASILSAAPAETPMDADLGSGPISTPTHLTRLASPVPEGRRPCWDCGGEVMPDGYCEQCGAKARDPRDHFREAPAPWVAGVCDKGIRHRRNEDAMALLGSTTPGERAVLIVLDGVSSSTDSDIASLAGARAAREVLRTPLPSGMGTPASRLSAINRVVTDAVGSANQAIIDTTVENSPNPASATLACAVVEGPLLVYANVGDSRVYWVPDVGPPLQLTIDDSAAQLQIESGIAREVAEASPMAHSITKWLGRDSHEATPRVGHLELTGAGWVLACSDGLWNYASDPVALADQVHRLGIEPGGGPATAADLATRLVDFANTCGGADNITVALARIEIDHQTSDTERETHG